MKQTARFVTLLLLIGVRCCVRPSISLTRSHKLVQTPPPCVETRIGWRRVSVEPGLVDPRRWWDFLVVTATPRMGQYVTS